jgi:hypothetical protein
MRRISFANKKFSIPDEPADILNARNYPRRQTLRKLVGGFVLTAALAFAGAGNTYRIDLYQKTILNGASFKPGECKLQVEDNHLLLKQGKQSAEAEVKVENSPNKFSATSIGYTTDGRIQEIRLGGTTTKLIFDTGTQAGAAAGR